MKNLYLTILSLSLFTLSQAQPSLTTANNMPVSGDSYIMVTADSSAPEGSSGENVTWNFNTLAVTNDSGLTTTYLDPDGTPYGADFPTSNLAVNLTGPGTNEFNYYKTTATDWQQVGTADTGATESFTDPMLQFTYPFTYGTTQTDNYAGISDSFSETGTVTKTGDAYGTLLLQGHTFNNVLRVKTIDTFSYIEDGINILNEADTTYQWYDTQHHYPLLTVEYVTAYIFGFALPSAKGVFSTQLGPAGISTIPAAELHFNVYPNPGKGTVYASYSLPADNDVSITVTNMLGQIVLSQAENSQPAGNHTVAFNNLAPGIYTVQLKTGNTATTKKLVIGE